jgi:hypothetical protein
MKQILVGDIKHVVVEHHLHLMYGALKANKLAWEKYDLEIKTIKADCSAESNAKTLRDLFVQQAQIHAVIILLTNSLIEALANFYLTNKCDEEQFKTLERLSTLDKLVVVPKLLLKQYEFPKDEELYYDLKLLLDLRTSLVHPKPRVTVNEATTHKGNLAKKSSVLALTPEKCVSLPARVVAHIWNFDHGALAELWINKDFSEFVKSEDVKVKNRLKQRAKNERRNF